MESGIMFSIIMLRVFGLSVSVLSLTMLSVTWLCVTMLIFFVLVFLHCVSLCSVIMLSIIKMSKWWVSLGWLLWWQHFKLKKPSYIIRIETDHYKFANSFFHFALFEKIEIGILWRAILFLNVQEQRTWKTINQKNYSKQIFVTSTWFYNNDYLPMERKGATQLTEGRSWYDS